VQARLPFPIGTDTQRAEGQAPWLHFCWLLKETDDTESCSAEHRGLIAVCAWEVAPRSLIAAHNKRLLQLSRNPVFVGLSKATVELMLKEVLGISASSDHRGPRQHAPSAFSRWSMIPVCMPCWLTTLMLATQ
jgi:hypothetical protein